MFYAHWEVINDEAYKWFGYRFTHRDFYCIITDENGNVASIGWMP